jgi:hypothetical protein
VGNELLLKGLDAPTLVHHLALTTEALI